MSIDGADAARRGFRDQVLAAIVLGLEQGAWLKVHLEPRDEEELEDTMQKADLRWIFDGEDCADQIKLRTNPVKTGDLKRWTEQLAKTSTSTRRRVIYIGPLATTAHGYEPSEPVTFRHLATSSADLERQALIGLQQALDGNSVATVARVERVLDDLVTQLDAESLGGLHLTREEFNARIAEHLRRVIEHGDRNDGTNVSVGFRRLVLVHLSGLVHELVRYEVVNNGTRTWQPGCFRVKWTDSGRVSLLHGHAFDHGLDRNDWQFQRSSDQCLLELYFDGEIPPGEMAAWGLIVRREGVVRRVSSDVWEFFDPLLPTEGSHAAHVDLVVNGHVEWIEHHPVPSVCGPRLSWALHTSGHLLHLSARWKSHPDAPLAYETDQGWTAIEPACHDVGLQGLPNSLCVP